MALNHRHENTNIRKGILEYLSSRLFRKLQDQMEEQKIIHRAPLEQVQFSSVTQSCPTLCDPMDCSTPGLPVHHQLPEFTQTHVH